MGVATGDPVAFLSLNSDRLVAGFFACFWAGGVANPVNVRWTITELAYALNNCGASLLVVDDPFTALAEQLVQQVPSLRGVVYLGDATPPAAAVTYAELSSFLPVPDAMRSGDDEAFVPDPGVMPTHLQFKLVFHALGKPAAGKAKGEIGMKIMRRMRAEGIRFPEVKL